MNKSETCTPAWSFIHASLAKQGTIGFSRLKEKPHVQKFQKKCMYWGDIIIMNHTRILKIRLAFCILTNAFSNFARIQRENSPSKKKVSRLFLNVFTWNSRRAAHILSLVIRPAGAVAFGSLTPTPSWTPHTSFLTRLHTVSSVSRSFPF